MAGAAAAAVGRRGDHQPGAGRGVASALSGQGYAQSRPPAAHRHRRGDGWPGCDPAVRLQLVGDGQAEQAGGDLRLSRRRPRRRSFAASSQPRLQRKPVCPRHHADGGRYLPGRAGLPHGQSLPECLSLLGTRRTGAGLGATLAHPGLYGGGAGAHLASDRGARFPCGQHPGPAAGARHLPAGVATGVADAGAVCFGRPACHHRLQCQRARWRSGGQPAALHHHRVAGA